MRSRPTRLRAAVAAATLAAVPAAAAQASAATLTSVKACYVNTPAQTAQVAFVGSGYTPGDTIDVSGGGVFAEAVANSAGQILAAATGPVLGTSGPAAKTFSLSATDTSTGATGIAATTIRVANLSVGTVPAVAKPTRKVTWRFSGFAPGRRIYVHYLRKHAVARAAFGRASGPCGLASGRAPLFPGGHPQYSSYRVVVDQVKRYSKRARPQIVTSLSFF